MEPLSIPGKNQLSFRLHSPTGLKHAVCLFVLFVCSVLFVAFPKKNSLTSGVRIQLPESKPCSFVRFITDVQRENDILWFDQMLLLLAALSQVRGEPPRVDSSSSPFFFFLILACLRLLHFHDRTRTRQ